MVAEAPTAPRVVMASGQFELLGLLDGHGLRLYLDNFATNAPVMDAELEIELDGKVLLAEPLTDGTYALSLNAPLKEGIYPLLVTVLTDVGSDLLIGELDVHGPPDPVEGESAESALLAPYIPWLLGVFTAFLLLLLWVIRADRADREDSA